MNSSAIRVTQLSGEGNRERFRGDRLKAEVRAEVRDLKQCYVILCGSKGGVYVKRYLVWLIYE